jgi:hypothetical protein
MGFAHVGVCEGGSVVEMRCLSRLGVAIEAVSSYCHIRADRLGMMGHMLL